MPLTKISNPVGRFLAGFLFFVDVLCVLRNASRNAYCVVTNANLNSSSLKWNWFNGLGQNRVFCAVNDDLSADLLMT